MPNDIAELLHELIVATRILANENVLDAFGHVSVRHPHDPQRYFIPRHRAPELAEISDIVELNLESEPVKPTEFRLYSEKVIHGEIYKARPEVNAVCHHHAHTVLPYAISGQQIVPVFHLAAVIGHVPFWDQRDEFGDTNTPGDQAGGRRFARARARTALDGAHAPPRRHRRRLELARADVPHRVRLRKCQAAEPGHGAGPCRSALAGRDRARGGARRAPALARTRLGLLGAPGRKSRADAGRKRRQDAARRAASRRPRRRAAKTEGEKAPLKKRSPRVKAESKKPAARRTAKRRPCPQE